MGRPLPVIHPVSVCPREATFAHGHAAHRTSVHRTSFPQPIVTKFGTLRLCIASQSFVGQNLVSFGSGTRALSMFLSFPSHGHGGHFPGPDRYFYSAKWDGMFRYGCSGHRNHSRDVWPSPSDAASGHYGYILGHRRGCTRPVRLPYSRLSDAPAGRGASHTTPRRPLVCNTKSVIIIYYRIGLRVRCLRALRNDVGTQKFFYVR